MTKESKQLNWFLLGMVVVALFLHSCIEVVPPGDVRPIQVDVGSMRASDEMLRQLADMSLQCDIGVEVIEFSSDDILTNDEVILLGDLCVERAEEEIINSNPFLLGVQKEQYKYEKNGGLRM